MEPNQHHDEKIVGSSLPDTTERETRGGSTPCSRPTCSSTHRQLALRRVTQRRALAPWEMHTLEEKFDSPKRRFPQMASDYYAIHESFVNPDTNQSDGLLRTVVVEWQDGKKTEYRYGRLRQWNAENRRTGLRGDLHRRRLLCYYTAATPISERFRYRPGWDRHHGRGPYSSL